MAAFDREQNIVPTAIGTIEIILADKPATDTDPASKSAHFRVSVLNSDGQRIKLLRGDLQPHLTTAQIDGLLTFMSNLRTQAETEILPI